MPEQQREKHLYLALDDWHSGYSIRKVSLSRRSGKPVGSSSSGESPEPLPPVFMRVQVPRGFAPKYFASAFGTKILMMHPCIAKELPDIPMIDVEEHCLVYGPEPNYNAFPIYFPVGDNSYSFWIVPHLIATSGGRKIVNRGGGRTSLYRHSRGQMSPPMPCNLMDASLSVPRVEPPSSWTQPRSMCGGKHVSAILLHMRPGRFCVVECVNIDDGKADEELRGPGRPQFGWFMYRVKTFSLGYDAKGDLKLTNCRVRCYNLPKEVSNRFVHGDLAAFWL